jgi:hypothetical protein
MHDPANGLRRIPLPQRWMNKGPGGRSRGSLRPLTANLWIPQNYCPFSAARQPPPAQVLSACRRETSLAEGLAAGYVFHCS